MLMKKPLRTVPRVLIFVGFVALCAVSAFAQTPPTLNDQLQFGDVFATMAVDTRGSTQTGSGASSSATAIGNTASAANLTGPLALRSRQTFSGAANATATLTADDACCYAAAVATTQGNALEAQHVGGAATLDARQTADGGDVSTLARANIRNTSQFSVAATSAQNNAATASSNGAMNASIDQNSSASAYAVADADACCSGLTVASAGSSINAFSGEAHTSTTRTDVTQTSTGANSRAAVDAFQMTAVDATAAANASGNSATFASEWGYADVHAIQDNRTAIAADARLQLGSWTGTGTASAYGVGNAVLATNIGSDLNVDVMQLNSGGVSATAAFTGGATGVDSGLAVLSTAAIGNAATAWACSTCGQASAYGSVNQTNGGAITSTGAVTTTGAMGVVGSASAIGNSASFVTTTRQN
jgi:hypothetical protein